MTSLTFEWDTGRASEEAAHFAASAIGRQASYISHGEIQTGLSIDGETWIDGLEGRFREDFANPGETREMLIARRPGGAIAAMGIISWETGDRVRYGTIEDMAVDPDSRGEGIGKQLLDRLVARLEEHGCQWAFLESGRENHRAHAFFEANAFAEISHVFARKLG